MADPVAIVERIVKIGLKIKDAVDTVRHNEDVCRKIRKSVLRLSAILQQTGTMNDSPAISGALEDLEKTLQKALELVTACQERSTIHRLVRAGDLAKQLREVKDDIWDNVMLASFAIHTTIILQSGGHPPLRQPEDAGVAHSTDDARSELNDMESFVPFTTAFMWSTLEAATNGFSDENIIGQGGSFTIYKGVLEDGNTVAIKKINRKDVTFISYDKLVPVISRLRHKNIVKFVGYCDKCFSTSVVQLFDREKERPEESEFIWVEEYVPNGSLYDTINERRLDWPTLFMIIEGVAQGLHYLHQQRIVHLDVKPSNILLESDMNPKITDFGISVALDVNDEMILEHIAGTFGYMAPEFYEEGIISTKNDVYAFGTTLIMLVFSISRMGPPRDSRRGYSYITPRMVWKIWERGAIGEEFDPSLFDGSQIEEISRCVQVALVCDQAYPEDRPTMADVLEMLHGEKELPIPKIPSLYSSDYSSDSD